MDNYVLSDESLNNNNIMISFQGETTIIYPTMSRVLKPVKDPPLPSESCRTENPGSTYTRKYQRPDLGAFETVC